MLAMLGSNLLILQPLLLQSFARFGRCIQPGRRMMLTEFGAKQGIVRSALRLNAHHMTARDSEVVLVQSDCTGITHSVARWILPLGFAFLLSQGHYCEALTAQARAESRGAPFASGKRYEPVSNREKEVSDAFIERVNQAVSWLEMGRTAQAVGDFKEALLWYTQITEKDGDLALAEYARVGRALSLYELGDREQAFVEMEDVSVKLKGYPEVHAALAAALYVDKHSLVSAEQQFNIATMLDPNYADLFYVKDTRHWPPSLIEALGKFISLQ